MGDARQVCRDGRSKAPGEDEDGGEGCRQKGPEGDGKGSVGAPRIGAADGRLSQTGDGRRGDREEAEAKGPTDEGRNCRESEQHAAGARREIGAEEEAPQVEKGPRAANADSESEAMGQQEEQGEKDQEDQPEEELSGSDRRRDVAREEAGYVLGGAPRPGQADRRPGGEGNAGESEQQR